MSENHDDTLLRLDRYASFLEQGERPPVWSVILPFFNEQGFLATTLRSLARQTVPVMIILVDNGSTDGSALLAWRECHRHGLPFRLISEPQPGKVAALATGLRQVVTRFVATCDADTWYPPDYLAQAGALLARPDCAVAGAYYVPPGASAARRLVGAIHILTAAQVFPALCHAGGAGQAFDVAKLRAVGGFDPGRWNFVLEDHEIIHRTRRLGETRYSANFWCSPSPRKRDRASVKWTALEQLHYYRHIAHRGDWFFYEFLAPRLAARRLTSEHLRERSLQPTQGAIDATPHTMRG
ncbi:glycosyltransferase family 2 protein [Sphingomonas sp. ERG5]|uniref:glycosyltransferase family 2 protein n=1 Tax=Sphingomonas sp. ERG5 TaxID=1381597 RepID=UPI001F3B9823|nr:glycosyltransferase family 2 protein [Sphingomonas sp. ERG5]